MIFFILDYCKEIESDSLFFTDLNESSLMCITKYAPKKSLIPHDHTYIECIVKGMNSNVSFNDFLDKAKSLKNGKVGLGAIPDLVVFYKSNGFSLINKFT